MSRRYAIYYAPAAESPLAGLGAEILGRDALSGQAVEQPCLRGFSAERLAAITREPRHYGFHATLKPPFQLAEGRSPEELRQALANHAEAEPAFAVELTLGILSGFVALLPRRPSAELHRLADSCVAAFDEFRRLATPEELQRRRAKKLTPAQEQNLVRWGYPYVFEEFRFHMTLSQRLEREEAMRLVDCLQDRFAPVLAEPVAIDGIALFAQPTNGLPFQQLTRLPLVGAVNRAGRDRRGR